jgi:thiol-disulfide isomerase/thioredoxin
MNVNRIKIGLIFSLLLVANSALALTVGDVAPQIIGRDISGNLFALTRLDKKPKVINFFWVDCKPCQKELPLLAKKEKEYPQVIFVAVHAEINHDTDSNYNIEDIQAFGAKLKAHPKALVLGSDRLKQQFGIEGFPASVLLDKNNKVEQILYGFNKKTITILENWLDQQK